MLTNPASERAEQRTGVVHLRDLRVSERRFLQAMQSMPYGRFEFLKIENGELVLDPWPITVRDVKFGSGEAVGQHEPGTEFRLKKQVSELFEYIRSIQAGEIQQLLIKGGLPFLMQVAEGRPKDGGTARE